MSNSISLPPPELEDRCLDLLIAVIEAARRDIRRPSTPEYEREEAAHFLQWAAETLIDDDTPRFRGG